MVFRGCVTMNERFARSLNLRLAVEARPASVQMMNFDKAKSDRIRSSNGINVGCSFSFPENTVKASGIPFPSRKSPNCTMGLGRCSLLLPYLRIPDSSSISKKKFV